MSIGKTTLIFLSRESVQILDPNIVRKPIQNYRISVWICNVSEISVNIFRFCQKFTDYCLQKWEWDEYFNSVD